MNEQKPNQSQNKFDNIRNAIKAANGRIFSAKFIKRTTGEERVILCRVGVKKYLKGGELKYDPKANKLQIVYDIQKKQYRSIPLENILSIKIEGKEYNFDSDNSQSE